MRQRTGASARAGAGAALVRLAWLHGGPLVKWRDVVVNVAWGAGGSTRRFSHGNFAKVAPLVGVDERVADNLADSADRLVP